MREKRKLKAESWKLKTERGNWERKKVDGVVRIVRIVRVVGVVRIVRVVRIVF